MMTQVRVRVGGPTFFINSDSLVGTPHSSVKTSLHLFETKSLLDKILFLKRIPISYARFLVLETA